MTDTDDELLTPEDLLVDAVGEYLSPALMVLILTISTCHHGRCR